MSSMFPLPARRRPRVRGLVAGALLLGVAGTAFALFSNQGSATPGEGEGAKVPALSTVAPPPSKPAARVDDAAQEAPAPEPERPVPARADQRAEESTRAAVARAEAAGDANALRRALGRAVLDEQLPAPLRAEWFERADELNRRLVFSAAQSAGFSTEEVRRGESYWKICERLRKDRGLKLAPGLLEAINHVPSGRLRSGQTIKIPEEPLSILVDKSEFRLYVLIGGVYAQRYEVGIGREELTPDGEFVVGGKMIKPPWTDPETGKTYRYGEAGHEIGSRWMALMRDGRKTSYGIHGTNEPGSIGKAMSDGCIRMRNEEVERLYELVADGVAVTIRP